MHRVVVLMILTFQQASLGHCEKVIRVTPQIEAHLTFLRGLDKRDDIEIDFWRSPSYLFQAVDIEVSEKDFSTLSSILEDHGIDFEVQINDVQKLIEEELETVGGRSGEWHDRYHNLEEIHSKLNEFSGRMASILYLGRSHEGREMRAIQIKGRGRYNKPVFFIQCGIHAREWVSPATCMYIIDQMTQRYGKDSSVTALLDKMDFVILPVLNVDGYAYTWINPRDRKYRRYHGSRYRCHGVDLNRNWNHGWGGSGASHRPCDTTYRGSSPFSEIETRNVRNYLEGMGGKLKGFIDFHAYSQMWFIPWGYTSRRTPDYSEQIRVAKAASDALRREHGTRFKYGSSASLLYPASGGSEDWTYGKLGVTYSFSVELRDTGRHGFLLPANQIIPTGEETFEGLKALVREMRV
ncbi:unnamed protein product [Pocillopora meandrina]|uniref:Peptidase M14 domain-containing protein n=1 Tax=Pocillopora meandrina TaxID=46732 RepID=A0AAU9WI87_9CNID|nr:unnamed protein product [Pocillopora meandrina]